MSYTNCSCRGADLQQLVVCVPCRARQHSCWPQMWQRRGLDILGVQGVINYDAPRRPARLPAPRGAHSAEQVLSLEATAWTQVCAGHDQVCCAEPDMRVHHLQHSGVRSRYAEGHCFGLIVQQVQACPFVHAQAAPRQAEACADAGGRKEQAMLSTGCRSCGLFSLLSCLRP